MTLDLRAADRFDLSPFVPDANGPGAVAAVLSRGDIRSWVARGKAGFETDAPALTPDTIFYSASVSKQFTAACIAVCERDGLIDIDRSIRQWLPELPILFEPATPRLLLHHLAGMPGGHELEKGTWPPEALERLWDGLGLWELIAILAQERQLPFAPGERFSYSNAGYWLLAACVERASGLSFREFAHRHLFAPLGMVSTRFKDDPDAPQPGLVLGHHAKDGVLQPVRTRFYGVGDGGLLTNIRDLAKWDVFWTGRSALGPGLPLRMVERGRRRDGAMLYYAWGVTDTQHRGTRIIAHSGGFIGYLTRFVRFADCDFSIACLANANSIDVDGLTMALADATLGDRADPQAPSWKDTEREDALAA